jgi:hypothetical protein
MKKILNPYLLQEKNDTQIKCPRLFLAKSELLIAKAQE